MIAILIIASGGMYYMRNMNKSEKEFVQQKYSIENTSKENFLIKIKDGYSEEIINSDLMDEFIENIEGKKEDKINIIEYARNENGEIVTSFKELNYDGNKVEVLNYDVSNAKEFKEEDSTVYYKITKTGDNFGARIIGTTSEVQPVVDGDIIFEYVESNKVEYQ